MQKLLFCNIGWMTRYEGLLGKPDKIVGGGAYVRQKKKGHEVCNFLPAPDGFVYGHVETVKGKIDRQIRLDKLDIGEGDKATGINVVWTATDPDNRGRKVIGWYRNATVFRNRQYFKAPPTKQHRRDGIDSYRIVARSADCWRLDFNQRDNYELGRGQGWIGHTPWWSPKANAAPEIMKFVRRIERLIEVPHRPDSRPKPVRGPGSPGASSDAYIRYVEAYEATITPRHNDLQTKFCKFLALLPVTDVRPNVLSVDLRFRDTEHGHVLVEVKPCDTENARYAIRSAMGQLLDYRQRAPIADKLLIVVETRPNDEDIQLALGNGFGIAFPRGRTFDIRWPDTSVED